MAGEVFFRLLMGHLVGDYVLQGKLMATEKGQSHTVQGWLWCILHCVIYTTMICLFLWKFSWLLVVGIFASHFFIDKFNLTTLWLKYTGGRTFEDALQEPDKNKRPFSIAFACIVYAVVDNTFHFLLMWAVLKGLGIV
jgi:hypothetical protein